MQENVSPKYIQIASLSSKINESPSKKSIECYASSSSSSSSSSSQAKRKDTQNILGSLCSLFLSEYFTIDMAMEYLQKKEDKGTIDFLVNLLFTEKYIDYSFFYLPQLCTLVRLKTYNEPIERFIIVQSTLNLKFAVCSTWFLNSYLDNDPTYYMKIIDKIETNMINGKKSSNKSDITDKIFIDKENKLEHFDRTIKLYEKLQSLCEKLKNIQTKPNLLKKKRNALLMKGLNAFNRSINNMLTNNKLKSFSYFGFILPFDSIDKDDLIIVNFLSKYSFCFSTKARVPVKITVECINSNESEAIEEQIKNQIEEDDEDNKENKDNDVNANSNELESVEDFANKITNTEEQSKAKAIIEAVKYENEHPDMVISNINNEEIKVIINSNPIGDNTNVPFQSTNTLTELPNPFETTWETTTKQIKENSRFRRFTSLTIKSFLAKANDDLRQELMTMQMIKKFHKIFKEANLPLHLHPYEIIITSKSSGLIEFLPDTISIDALKKMLPSKCLISKFYRSHFKNTFIHAQKNFCESLAAYSLVSYLLSIKDRHNGNILIDTKGNIIHIDFGFILGISPGGNLNFENAPFKMTKEYIRLLDGEESEIFFYFKSIFLRGLIEARKHVDTFINIVETMAKGDKMPCFAYGSNKEIINSFKDRFMIGKTDNEIISMVDELIYRACNSWRTYQYDIFQKLTNGILP